jgi:cellulose synthase/poly-beta-1,6-N-acetylglucosamine synthase-like glycosyltransferase
MISLVVNLFYFLLIESFRQSWKRLSTFKVFLPDPEVWPTVSVIIPFRNEKDNLATILSNLNKLDYEDNKLEFIFVDDHSEDGGFDLDLSDVKFKCQLLSLKDVRGKKAALTLGINASTAEWIATTDADCSIKPMWLKSMIRKGDDCGAVMVCGTVNIANMHSFFTQLQSIEMLTIQHIGAASLSNGMPLVNTGASLMFKRTVFHEVNGYASSMNIPSGDDTFLMIEMNNRYPGAVVADISNNAAAETLPMLTLKELFQQHIRWGQKTVKYKNLTIKLIGLLTVLSSFLFLIQLLGVILLNWSLFYLVLTILLRAFAELRFLSLLEQYFNFRHTLLAKLAMIFLYPLFLVVVAISGFFVSPKWKGR